MVFILAFLVCLPTLLFGKICGEEVLRTARTIVCKRTVDHDFVNMNGNVVPYSSDAQKLMNNSGHFFSVYEAKDSKTLISTVNFFQWEPGTLFFERTVAVKKPFQSQRYGSEIAIALNDYIRGQFSPCVIADQCDRKQCYETLMIGQMTLFGYNREDFRGYWCATLDLATLSYTDATHALGLSEDHPFHPKHWIVKQ
jgi:hypothetical protein